MRRMRGPAGEEGMSLVDVLVSGALAMVVTTLVVTLAVAGYRATRFSNQDSDALGALRVALDRLEEEVRQARFLYPASSTDKTMKFWVDTDLDRQQDLSERITWSVSNVSGTTAQLTRVTDAPGDTPQVLTKNLLWNETFAYFTYDIDNSLVSISYIADVDTESLAPQRSVTTDVKLRNLSI